MILIGQWSGVPNSKTVLEAKISLAKIRLMQGQDVVLKNHRKCVIIKVHFIKRDLCLSHWTVRRCRGCWDREAWVCGPCSEESGGPSEEGEVQYCNSLEIMPGWKSMIPRSLTTRRCSYVKVVRAKGERRPAQTNEKGEHVGPHPPQSGGLTLSLDPRRGNCM